MLGLAIVLSFLVPVAFIAGAKWGYLWGWRHAYQQAMDDGWASESKEISA